MEYSPDEMKKVAATEALKLVKDGMVLGLGTGSTVKYFLDGLGEMVKKGTRITGVPTSEDTARIAREHGIHVDENFTGKIDLDVDGADEIDSQGNLIKGGGGALLREKIVARNSKSVCIIADETKFRQEGLGDFGVPVEVFRFLHQNTLKNIENLGGNCKLRADGAFVTDNGNYVLDCNFGLISKPEELEQKIKMIPGVAEVGIFTSLCDMVVLGTKNGPKVEKIRRV